ncbi:MAG: hypothetical protein ABEJ36_01570 [Candidatus Nanosalina sp.]
MEFQDILSGRFEEGLEKDLLLILASLLIISVAVGINNFRTPDEPMRVGLNEIETECYGINAGICIGLQKRNEITYNYANYETPEPGDPNFYRRVESELMAQAYNICNSENITGFEWTSEASYLNRTGSEWRQMQEVKLLPCESTFFRKLDAPN